MNCLSQTKKVLPNILLINFFAITTIFQIHLVTQLAFLYPVLKILFYLEMLALFFSAIITSWQNKVFFLAFLLIIAIRIPFYLQGDGLIFHSDNALEALQPLEIQDNHRAPFFLLNSSGHNGTLKYLFVAFIWDLLGKSYTTFVLFQLLIFLVFIYLFTKIFERYVDERIVHVFLLAHFAFIEVIFDYSLFLRAAPYLEMLTVFLLGIYLFDFSFQNKTRLFLAFYFLIFSSYLHPLVIFLIVPFALVSIIYSLVEKKFRVNLRALLAGGLLATYHLIYYKFFWPPPPPSGAWYQIVFFSPSQFAFNQIPLYIKNLLRDLWISFHNLFDYEFLYSLYFFQDTGLWVNVLKILNRMAIFLSLAVCLGGIILSLIHLIRSFHSFPEKRWSFSLQSLRHLPWPYAFYLLTFLVFVFKAFILSPRPYYEPRHNIDLALWIGIGFVLLFGSFAIWHRSRLLRLATAIFLLFLTAPHYIYYLKVAIFKKESYNQIIPVLRENKVRYLATDFSLAYPIYFLTNRKVKVTDSLGPVSISFFYYWLREEMEKVPWQQKAYLFFGDRYRRRPWHVEATVQLRRRLIERLKKENIRYRVFNLPYYTIIIPETAVNLRPP